MAPALSTKLQRLRTLEKEIRGGMEEFYYVGMRLKEIRDDRLYKEAGFETFEKYVKETFDIQKRHANRLISSAEYREQIKSGPSGSQPWTERSVRELKRLEDPQKAARVAAKIVKEVDKPDGPKLSSSYVRQRVNEELGITPTKPEPKQQDNGIDWREYLERRIGTIDGIRDNLQAVPKEGWRLLKREQPMLLERFSAVVRDLAALIERVG